MKPNDESFVIRVTSVTLAVILILLTGGIVYDFTAVRLRGYPVDLDRFYGLVGPCLVLVLNGFVNLMHRGRK